MKLMKKLLTILFAFMMVLATTSMVFAEDTEGTSATKDGTITITNVVNGQNYEVYKVLELESFHQPATGDGIYAYKLATGWNDFLTAEGVSDYLQNDGEGYVTWKNAATDEATVAKLAKLASKYIEDHSTTIKKINEEDTGVQVDTTTAGQIKYTNLPLGYYLVKSSTGALCSLDTTRKAIEIKEKNAVPTMTKDISITGGTGVKDNNVEIGDTVNFEVKITAKAGAQNYVLHDTMDAGFAWNGNVNVALLKNGSTGPATTVDTANYTVVTKTSTPETVNDGCTFEVKFKQDFCDTLGNDDQIIVTYKATLNKNAKITTQTETAGNDNKAQLAYGTKTENKTAEEKTTTKTFEFNVFKYTGTNTGLADVTFTLARKSDGTEPVELEKDATTNNYFVKQNDGTTTATATEIKTDSTGKFTVKGLKAGKYYLTETDAPKGYNKLSKPVEITVGDNGTVSLATGASELTKIDGGEIKIENKTGTVLPSTGGVGTTMMYIVGAALLIGSGVLLITKKNAK